jgi:hypothetical protein
MPANPLAVKVDIKGDMDVIFTGALSDNSV